MVLSRPSSAGEKARTGARSSCSERRFAQHFEKQAQGCPPRLFDGPFAARQWESPKVSHTLPGSLGDDKKLPAPNRAIQAVTRAVPGNAQCRGRHFVFRHARKDMGHVMLDAHQPEAASRHSARKPDRGHIWWTDNPGERPPPAREAPIRITSRNRRSPAGRPRKPARFPNRQYAG